MTPPRPPDHDQPSRGTRRARWGIFVTTVVMGAALVATALTTWLSQREAARSVAEARAMDVFQAVRRTLRDEAIGRFGRGSPEGGAGTSGPDGGLPDLAALLSDFEDAGLRYIAFTARGAVVAEAGAARGGMLGESGEGREGGEGGGAHDGFDALEPRPGPEPTLTRLPERVRVDGGLAPRRGRGLRLVLEVEPVLAARLEAAAFEHLVVSAVAAALLLALAFWFWRMARRADRFEAALGRQRRLAALGEMSAVLGHELRNPLAALKGHAQLVVERLEPEHKAAKNAARVVQEAERIETLTSHVLDFARTGAVQPSEVDPAALVREVAERVAGSGVVLDLTRAPGRWWLDRPRMEQVLANLVKNAIEAGGAPVEVTCAEEAGALAVRVRDHGAGFPPGEEALVFEPFRTHRTQGTGLGLTIAQRIVEAHGGRITARNAAGGGAEVEVVVPGRPARPMGGG